MFLLFSLLFCHLNFPAPFHDKETKTWLASYQNIISFFSSFPELGVPTLKWKKHSTKDKFLCLLLSQNCVGFTTWPFCFVLLPLSEFDQSLSNIYLIYKSSLKYQFCNYELVNFGNLVSWPSPDNKIWWGFLQELD